MTASERGPGEESKLHGYETIIRLRAAVPTLATSSLDHIHALVERALDGEEPAGEVIAELARTLDPGA